jgi:uncharacterized protein involved in outer membrane biogenesis
MPRLLRRILLYSAGAFLFCLVALITLAYIYQDDVKNKLVAELNTHLRVPVQQSGIDLTLIQRFPEASLRIRDVLVKEVRTDSLPADTLLYAKELYLEFGLLSLLAGNYNVGQLHGEDVRLYAGLDKHGEGNWNIWKIDSTKDASSTNLKLNKVTFDGLNTRFRDERSQLEVRGESDELLVRGRIRDEGSKLTVRGDLHLQHWTDHGVEQLTDRQADVDLKLAFGGAQGGFQIEKGSEVLLAERDGGAGKTPVAVKLVVDRGPKGQRMDLRASGFNLDLEQVVALLPDGIARRLRHYDLSGNADVALHYGGDLESPGPALSVGLQLREGRFAEQHSGAVFKGVRGEFALELTAKGTPRQLTVKGLRAQAASGSISGDLVVNGAKNAKITADLKADVALADLLRFARIDTLEQVEGRLKADLRSTGKLRDLADVKAADLRALTTSGTVELKDASLKLRGVRHRITDLNTSLALKGNDATVHGLHCAVQGNAIELSGTLGNLVPYICFPDQRLIITAQGRSPKLDLASLFSSEAAANDRTAHDYQVKLPGSIDLDLRAQVEELVFEDFAAQQINGTIRLKDRTLRVDPITFMSAGGRVSGNLMLDGRGEGAYPLTIEAGVEKINITELFREFRDFGQQFITQKHLKGRSDVRLVLTASLSPALRIDQRSLHCVADLVIEQGELNDHAPMMAVADYLEKNKLVSPFVDTDELAARLKRVTFARLENQIEIKDRAVHVPRMLVQSSAMDIEVSGVQTFDGGVDDHLNFRLGDLFRLGKPESDEFGPIADDGTGMRIFIHMHGTTSDLKFSNDGAMAAARRRERAKQQSAELNGLLTDMWRGNKATPEPASNGAVITVIEDQPGTNANVATTPQEHKGLGKLLRKPKDEEEEEIITIE